MKEEVNEVSKRPRIPSEIRRQCFEAFMKGYGYKKTAALTGLKQSTVREYGRRYRSGDISWVNRGPQSEQSR